MIILPSLEIVPAKYNGNILLSQIPVNGTGDFTVSRALNTATRVNSLGNIEAVNADTPRIDYLTSSGTVGCPALLVEPSGTNNIRNNSMAGASVSGNALPTNWIVGGVGLTQQIVEVGTENGVSYIDLRLSGTATAGTATLSFESPTQIAALTGQNWTISSYLKTIALPSPPTSFVLAITERNSGGGIVVQQTTNVSLTSTLARYSYSPTLNGGATTAFAQPRLFFTLVIGQTYDFTIRIGYPQMELGSVATSVIPTTTAAVTRNADLISVSGAVSGSIGQTQGTIYAEVDVRNWVNNSRIFSISDGTQTNRIMTLFNSSNRFRVIVDAVSGSAQVDISSSSLTNGVHKIAVGYAANDVVFYVNGVLVGSDTTVNIPACSQAFLGKIETSASSNFLNDRIRAAALYTTRLTNTQLALLTSPYTSYSSMASALSYTLG